MRDGKKFSNDACYDFVTIFECAAIMMLVSLLCMCGNQNVMMGLEFVLGSLMPRLKKKCGVRYEPKTETRRGQKKRNRLVLKADRSKAKKQRTH